MKALTDLLTTDYGLLSAFTIGMVLVIGGFFCVYAIRHIRADTQRHDQLVRRAKGH